MFGVFLAVRAQSVNDVFFAAVAFDDGIALVDHLICFFDDLIAAFAGDNLKDMTAVLV